MSSKREKIFFGLLFLVIFLIMAYSLYKITANTDQF